MPDLDGPRLAPKSGLPDMIVFLLHGYGADGHDLIDLAPLWAQAAPRALFVAPHAPFPCEAGPYGRQWFSLAERNDASRLAGARMARPILEAFIAAECARAGLPESAILLMGFSQGAMMTLHTGLRRATAPLGLMAYSGLLVGAETMADEIACRPDTLLVHGEADPVVPVQGSQQAEAVLRRLDVPVESLYRPGLGHGLDDAGLTAGGLFLQRAAARLAA